MAFANKGKWHLKVGYDLYSNRNPHTCVLEEAKDLAGWYVCYLLRAFTGYISLIFLSLYNKDINWFGEEYPKWEDVAEKKERGVHSVAWGSS